MLVEALLDVENRLGHLALVQLRLDDLEDQLDLVPELQVFFVEPQERVDLVLSKYVL